MQALSHPDTGVSRFPRGVHLKNKFLFVKCDFFIPVLIGKLSLIIRNAS